jgi:hypothetical protein
MLTESYGGICPNCCYDRMLVRYGGIGYFQFDACPNCGFNYGTNHYDGETFNSAEFWDGQVKILESQLKERGLPLSMLGILLYIETLPDMEEIDQVFDYHNLDWETMKFKEEKTNEE